MLVEVGEGESRFIVNTEHVVLIETRRDGHAGHHQLQMSNGAKVPITDEDLQKFNIEHAENRPRRRSDI